jgi:glycosyltransferase involved in cell wall biosynthesis
MNKKKKLLILQNKILNYRVPVYEELHKQYEVTVIHAGKPVNAGFNEKILKSYKIGSFIFLKNFKKTTNKIDPDFILSMFDLHWPQYYINLPKYSKNVYWGLDNSKSSVMNFIKKAIVNFNKNNILFYSKPIQDNWLKKINVPSFVAQNTVLVGEPSYSHERNIYVNVGSLHYRKRNDILIKAFANLPKEIINKSKVVLVGAGSDEERLKTLCRNLNVNNNISFIGYIDDLESLGSLYNSSVCSVSVGQAGLAVSQSLGYGVPFVTHKNAITGGEIHGVVHGLNGHLLESAIDDDACVKELSKVMEFFWKSRKDIQLYKGCRGYFNKNLSLDCMIQSIKNSLVG